MSTQAEVHKPAVKQGQRWQESFISVKTQIYCIIASKLKAAYISLTLTQPVSKLCGSWLHRLDHLGGEKMEAVEDLLINQVYVLLKDKWLLCIQTALWTEFMDAS